MKDISQLCTICIDISCNCINMYQIHTEAVSIHIEVVLVYFGNYYLDMD